MIHMKMFKWQMNISIFKQLKGALTQHCQAWLQRMPPMQQEATLCTSGFLLKASVKTSGNKKWAVLGSATSRDHLKQCILSNAILARLFRQKLHTCGSHGHMMKLGCIWFQSADENNAKCMDKNYTRKTLYVSTNAGCGSASPSASNFRRQGKWKPIWNAMH